VGKLSWFPDFKPLLAQGDFGTTKKPILSYRFEFAIIKKAQKIMLP
jgi:hypothetical protein